MVYSRLSTTTEELRGAAAMTVGWMVVVVVVMLGVRVVVVVVRLGAVVAGLDVSSR